MTYNFCTLFDSNYFSKGLALYKSLEMQCEDFHLFIFAFDKISYDVLKKLNLSEATIISLEEFEDEELLKIKPTRSAGEYCWTATSSTILFIIEKYKVESCTYIDADIFFYSSPKPIFDELGDKSILLTEHRYSAQYKKKLNIAGKYCVQFITFKNDKNGLNALKWWRERCLEWCYSYYEDGKYGDQLYLEDWTTRFEGVHVLQHLGGGVALWNISDYNFEQLDSKIIGTRKANGEKFEVIFYHFHYLKFYSNDSLTQQVELGRIYLADKLINIFYKRYVKLLMELKLKIFLIDGSFDPNGSSKKPVNWKSPFIYLLRKINKTYNIFDLKIFTRN